MLSGRTVYVLRPLQITMDPSIDFIAQCGQFDTAIMGRATYAKAGAMHGDASLPGLETVVMRYAAEDRLNGTPLINYVRRGDVRQGQV